MRASLLVALAAVGCSAGTGPAADPVPTSEPAGRGTVAQIIVERCDGVDTELTAVGATVDRNRLATVAHAFVDAASLTVLDASGSPVPAALLYLDQERDIAIVEVADDTGEWFSLGPTRKGEAVTVLAPTGDGDDPPDDDRDDDDDDGEGSTGEGDGDGSIGDGDGVTAIPASVVRIVDISVDGVGLRAGLELDVALDPGRSGAPVIDSDGVMVGMAFAADRSAATSWAVAANEIEAALTETTGDPIQLGC